MLYSSSSNGECYYSYFKLHTAQIGQAETKHAVNAHIEEEY